MSRRNEHTLISLFAGAGGLDLGLEQAGFQCLLANDVEDYACDTLRANRELGQMSEEQFDNWFEAQIESQRCYRRATPESINRLRSRLSAALHNHCFLREAVIVQGDIRDLSADLVLELAKTDRGEVTLIAGGPPCQPFSRAGKRETVDVRKGQLFLEFVRIVDEIRPRWFLFENVKGLAQTKTDIVTLTCPDCHQEQLVSFSDRLQYPEVKPESCDLCGGEAAQVRRKRESGGSLHIITSEFERAGYKCYTAILNAADFGVPQIRHRVFVVGSRDGEAFRWPTPSHFGSNGSNPKNGPDLFSSDQARNLTPEPWKSLWEATWKHYPHPKYGEVDLEKAKLWVKNVVRPHAEPVTWSLVRPSPTIGAHQAAKLALAPLGVPPAQIARQQWHTKGRRQGDTPPIPVEHEWSYPGFADTFSLVDSVTVR